MVRAIVLGSSRGMRHLDPNKSYPYSLDELEQGGRVLDWIIRAFASQGINKNAIVFVGGYHLEKVVGAYPGLVYYFNPLWEQQNDLASLKLVADDTSGACFICDTNVVFRSDALTALRQSTGDIALGTHEGTDRGQPIIGLGWFSESGIKTLRRFLKETDGGRTDLSLVGLFKELTAFGSGVRLVDLGWGCSALNDRASLARFVLGNKGETLERLGPLLKKASVLEQIRFSVTDWEINPGIIMERVRDAFRDNLVVVRSCSAAEDSWRASNAGHFKSVLSVNATDPEFFQSAVKTVIDSYGDLRANSADEVLVQPHLDCVTMSGVILSRDLHTNAPYYIVTVDRFSGRTDTVTSGCSAPVETYIIYRKAQEVPLCGMVADVVCAAKEVEALAGHDSLDIEFAVDTASKIYLLQVRPLVNGSRALSLAESDLDDELVRVREFVSSLMLPHPSLKGRTTILSNMADWNPAEMIGTSPRPLALSLYQVLITDYVWAEARRRIGYRDVTPEPLLVSLAGIPYVDVRASLNSFLPGSLDERTSERVVDTYLDCLKSNPELHDKIEFEVAVTCLAFDFERQAARLRRAGLSNAEIAGLRSALLRLTDSILLGGVAPIESQIALCRTLESRRRTVMASRPSGVALPRAIMQLVRDCVTYGTLPFAVLARYAFIALTFMRSLTEQQVFSTDEYNAFLAAIPTVATDVSRDLVLLRSGTMPRQQFVETYGHLRPGTYDLLSSNYAQSLDTYLRAAPKGDDSLCMEPGTCPNPAAVRLFESKRDQINQLLEKHGFEFDARALLSFVLRAIPGREWTKFEFSKNINEVLEMVAELAALSGLSREDASYLSIERILRLATDSSSCAAALDLTRACAFESKRHCLTASIRLPQLICGISDIDAFRVQESSPNFVTDKRVLADILDLEREPNPYALDGKIAVIRRADPGYDWIFTGRPAGLITQYGGAASHMAIRAAEFGLPAAIGCGDVIFERVRSARRVEIDCPKRQIRAFQ